MKPIILVSEMERNGPVHMHDLGGVVLVSLSEFLGILTFNILLKT